MVKPRTMPGVLELLPREQIAFQRMLDVIRRIYERHGFLPIETPAIELAEVLLTKSGGETERQVYFVQSSGALEQGRAPELALRFDLTVPLARYVAEHEAELHFPFRRYQIQRVYRGERAQRGRFREFYQCDIDIVGKDRLPVRHDAELPAVIQAVFEELAIGEFTIRLNHRRLLRGVLAALGVGAAETQAGVLRELDKLGKRSRAEVEAAIAALGLGREAAARLLDWAEERHRGYRAALAALAELPRRFAEGGALLAEGARELAEVLACMEELGVADRRVSLDFSIARGLDYYTGTVFETTLDAHPEIGSICSGGRYEDLASHYTRSRLPGVGISIGATRLFWQLREAGLIRPAASTVEALVCLLDDRHRAPSFALAAELRAAGIATEAVLEPRKLARQLQYADRAGIPFAVLLGDEELAAGEASVRDLRRGEQWRVARSELAATLRVEIAQRRALEERR
ncbi:MAG: histidine--tRNA ligase [Xanthomonadales bacterium]|nr:histidine--tRNA ligase [Xanthomonadales bacterium]